MTNQLAMKKDGNGLPPILAGAATPAVRKRVEQFFFSVASCFESWVSRRQSPHTQRAYREDVMTFVKFLGLAWPTEATSLLSMSIKDVKIRERRFPEDEQKQLDPVCAIKRVIVRKLGICRCAPKWGHAN